MSEIRTISVPVRDEVGGQAGQSQRSPYLCGMYPSPPLPPLPEVVFAIEVLHESLCMAIAVFRKSAPPAHALGDSQAG